ncbi:MAG: hypothetical protein AAFN77_21660 [Planctomycetota bacterium]
MTTRNRYIANTFLALLVGALTSTSVDAQETRDQKVRLDRKTVSATSGWFYDDLDQGLEAARKENKPLMVVLRCIP